MMRVFFEYFTLNCGDSFSNHLNLVENQEGQLSLLSLLLSLPVPSKFIVVAAV